ncbi:MAG TPA: hypothetical protein VHP32_06780 [Ignavibacteria bacterium]|nr:hypothetical protein [Ignavibacteria bacterium]
MFLCKRLNQWCAYSRAKTYYSGASRYRYNFMTYDLVVKTMDALAITGYLTQEIGYNNPEYGKGVLSKFYPTNKINELFTTDMTLVDNIQIKEVEPTEYIILKARNSEKNVYLDYDDNANIIRKRLLLKEYNLVRQACRFELPGSINENLEFMKKYSVKKNLNGNYDLFNPYIVRIFSGDFKRGGRFYRGIESNMPKELREQLMINGQKTVEVDYSCMHIRMLYNMMGIDYKDDAYAALAQGDPDLRKKYKLTGLISINSTNETNSIGAMRNEFRNNGLCKDSNELTNKNMMQYLTSWKTEHARIARFFNKDVGVKLQYKDSKISERIIKHFTKKGEPVLCIHDSFIVREGLKDELKECMVKSYEKEMSFEPKL